MKCRLSKTNCPTTGCPQQYFEFWLGESVTFLSAQQNSAVLNVARIRAYLSATFRFRYRKAKRSMNCNRIGRIIEMLEDGGDGGGCGSYPPERKKGAILPRTNPFLRSLQSHCSCACQLNFTCALTCHPVTFYK